jgi:hypothetical protein
MSDATQTRQRVRDGRKALIAENAARAFAGHAVTVEHEHGLYRHYRCGKPDSSVYAFHVVTFPGRVIVSGDVGDMAWSRCPDMLEWAAGAIQSIGYFADKTWGSLRVKEWSPEVATAAVEEEYADRLHDLDDEQDAHKFLAKCRDVRADLLLAIENGYHAFTEAYYGSAWYGGDFPGVEDYTAEFLWCREALEWFLAWYRATGRLARRDIALTLTPQLTTTEGSK